MEARVLSKEDENAAQILKDDQERINMFARLNNKLGDIKDELAALKKQSDNLEDAKSELIMVDEGGCSCITVVFQLLLIGNCH